MTSSSTHPYTYAPTATWRTARPPAVGRVTTSRTELTQIGIAYAVLTLDLVLVLSGGGLLLVGSRGGFVVSSSVLLVAAVAAFTGFVAHELAHKVSAQRRGFWAEFRMSPSWLLFSIFTAFLGFLFAAPGATVVGGMGDRRDWGRTSLAGPLTNLGFAVAFYGGAVAAFDYGSGAATWLLFLAFINGWFGAFNLLPFGPLDGRKVISWNAGVWAVSIVAVATVAVLSYIAFSSGMPLFAH
jgi:Zn-dependent protease